MAVTVATTGVKTVTASAGLPALLTANHHGPWADSAASETTSCPTRSAQAAPGRLAVHTVVVWLATVFGLCGYLSVVFALAI